MRVEFKSRTSTLPVFKLPESVLKVREQGITAVRSEIDKLKDVGTVESRSTVRKLIASMNFSVSQIKKELKKFN